MKQKTREFLHFCRRENLDEILQSMTLDYTRSLTAGRDYSGTHDDVLRANYAYDVARLENSACRIVFPFQGMDDTDSLPRKEKRKFLFWEYETTVIDERSPEEAFAAIIFKSEDILVNNYLIYKQSPNISLYCESYSEQPISFTSVREIDLNQALEMIDIYDPDRRVSVKTSRSGSRLYHIFREDEIATSKP
jgi:hypothetical protein